MGNQTSAGNFTLRVEVNVSTTSLYLTDETTGVNDKAGRENAVKNCESVFVKLHKFIWRVLINIGDSSK